MTEPARSSTVNIGGVKFNRNAINGIRVKNENGAELISVFLKNGVSLEYPRQKPESHANVYTNNEGLGVFDTDTNIYNLTDGKVKGSKGADRIALYGTNGVTVDTSGDDKVSILGDDYVSIYDNSHDGKAARNNRVIRDKKDHVIIDTENTKVTIDGESPNLLSIVLNGQLGQLFNL